jgi:hypothetical protein
VAALSAARIATRSPTPSATRSGNPVRTRRRSWRRCEVRRSRNRPRESLDGREGPHASLSQVGNGLTDDI